MRSLHENTVAGLIAGVLFATTTSWAAPFGPGFDLFNTPSATEGGLSQVTLADGAGGKIPVKVEGDSARLRMVTGIHLGNTDTIVKRIKGGDPEGDPDGIIEVDIEIVALALKSSGPVDLQGTLWDIEIEAGSLMNANLAPSTGTMAIDHAVPETCCGPGTGGGAFASNFQINAQITLTEVDNPKNQITQLFTDEFDQMSSQDVPRAQQPLEGGSLWAHVPAPHAPNHPQFPSGGFHPGIMPAPLTQIPGVLAGARIWTDEMAQFATHSVLPATPEPTGLALMGLPAMTLLRRRRTA